MNFLRPLFEKWLGSLIRSGMIALGGYLMAQGVVTEDQSAQLIALAPILAGIAWSLVQKYRTQIVIEVAKELPAGATNETVKAEVSASPASDNLARAMKVE